MHSRFEQILKSEMVRLRLIERLLHDRGTVWQVEIAGHVAPMVTLSVDDLLNVSAEFPALCPTEDEPVAYVLADGVPVYAVALDDEVHSGRAFVFSVTWMTPDLVRDDS